ncbi:MAG TPA: RDD family protein [Candidatus Eremiobacteraceae bacterium]|nr:RDD family protein [Candidatus Eremiobacteraceae bacterium]
METHLERNVSVRTPESIAFYYELAGLGSRFLAVAIDLLLQTLAVLAVYLLMVWAEPGTTAIAKSLGLRDETISAIETGIVIFVVFVIYFGYFVAFETAWNGRTPGKRAIGIRVVRDGGYPITFMDAVIRNLIRVGEAALGYLPSMISAIISPQNKRLGDIAAGTIVVRDRAFDVIDPSKWATTDAPESETLPGFDRITDDELALAERYVARSHMLDPHAAQAAASRIASSIRPKLGHAADDLTDHDLLVRVTARGRR